MSGEDVFTVDVPLEQEWLEAALASVKSGGIARVSVVIIDAGRQAKYKVRCLGGGEVEYMIASVAGDFTEEPAWWGTKGEQP